ncbi:hypothetical protein PHLCEN_2v7315 [Hermanssonia centrifuga]|uniref:BTB domain-containing protein n=1 Tax=Hermanssonia centrifuga TaxID=98765 RepID=A0A2R6NWN7_9APHY|nr:hypothetical protein PHLCEN_2v7315 [Hermanssonia centrifuga]
MSTNVVFGTWSAASTNDNNVDLEAQVVVGRYESSPSTVPYVYGPPPARTYSPRAQSAASQGTDPVDDFFGVTRSTSRGTQDSRHDDRRVSIHLDEEIAPPPYADSNDLPSYASVAEPPTLAMYLFKFGFLSSSVRKGDIIVASEPFDRQAADVILRTSDNVHFYVYKTVLLASSTFFKTIFSSCTWKADRYHGYHPIIDVPEDSSTLEYLLRFCYPGHSPMITNPVKLDLLLEAAFKYDISTAVEPLHEALQLSVYQNPLRVFAIACRHKLEDEADLAALTWKKQSFLDDTAQDFSRTCAGASYVPEMAQTSAGAYYRLLSYLRTARGNARFQLHESCPSETSPPTAEFPQPRSDPSPSHSPFNRADADVVLRSSDNLAAATCGWIEEARVALELLVFEPIHELYVTELEGVSADIYHRLLKQHHLLQFTLLNTLEPPVRYSNRSDTPSAANVPWKDTWLTVYDGISDTEVGRRRDSHLMDMVKRRREIQVILRDAMQGRVTAAAPFDRQAADVILRTSDNVDFYVYKIILTLSSTFFDTMFSLQQSPMVEALPEQRPVIEVSEDSRTLEYLLRFCYPGRDPVIIDLGQLDLVLEAALKYEVGFVSELLRSQTLQTFISKNSLQVFTIAVRHSLEDTAKMAAVRCATNSFDENPLDFTNTIAGGNYVPEMERIPAGAYYRLLSYLRSPNANRNPKFIHNRFCEPPPPSTEGPEGPQALSHFSPFNRAEATDYGMTSVVDTMRSILKRAVDSQPFRVYLIAVACNWTEEARSALELLASAPICKLYATELEDTSADIYHRLLKQHHQIQVAMTKVTNGQWKKHWTRPSYGKSTRTVPSVLLVKRCRGNSDYRYELLDIMEQRHKLEITLQEVISNVIFDED